MQLNVLSETKIILAANKLDLLPKQINKRRVKEWLKRTARKYGLEADDVVLISAEKGWGIDDLLSSIANIRENEDVYIVGQRMLGNLH